MFTGKNRVMGEILWEKPIALDRIISSSSSFLYDRCPPSQGRRGDSHQFWLEGEYLTISVLRHAEPIVIANLKGHRVVLYF